MVFGADAKHTEAISAEEEKQLWESGVLNVSTHLQAVVWKQPVMQDIVQ